MQRTIPVPIAMMTICVVAAFAPAASHAQSATWVAGGYHIYAGNTHAHTQYTWSHGYQWSKREGCAGNLDYEPQAGQPLEWSWSVQAGKEGYDKSKSSCPAIYVIGPSQYPAPGKALLPDWRTLQGPPSRHFELAKQAGFDFYTTSDHSEEAIFWPSRPDNPAWLASKQQARAATDSAFVALAGFEYSAHDGPGIGDHINVINSDDIVDSLAPGVNLPYFYKWLKTAKPNGVGPVVASFNHPEADQYDDWNYRDPDITGIITMLEVVNGNNQIHYDGFVHALDKGWKVSPVCGLDNHNTVAITKLTSRTFVLARSKTRLDILDAMKHRRTYASLDKNLTASYTVNGVVMGSTLMRPSNFKFDIRVSDRDEHEPKDKITKIDIVRDHGDVVASHTFDTPDYAVSWAPVITDTTSKYFFVRVWNAGGGDAAGADPTKPIAWLAPVWTGR